MRRLHGFLEVDESFTPDVSRIHNRGARVRSVRLSRLMGPDFSLGRWARMWMPRPMRRAVGSRLREANRIPVPPLDPEIRNELTRPQHDDILRLQDLVGRDLTHWLAK